MPLGQPVTPQRHPRRGVRRDLRGRDPGGQQQAGQRVTRVDRLLPGGVPVQRQEDLPAREPARQLVRGVHRQRRLADPGHPADRVNPHHRARPRRRQLLQLPLPPGERDQVAGQRAGRRRHHPARHRAQRRELRRQARGTELEDPHRAVQVLQPVHPQVPQRRPRRQSRAHQRGRRLRHQHLAPVTGRRHPGGAMHIPAHQARDGRRRLPGMDAHPHPHLLPARPPARLERALHVQRRRRARLGRGEHREERIPLGIDLPAVVSGQPRPDQRVVTGQQLRVKTFSQPIKQGRGALHIGKEERERLHGPSVGGPGPRRTRSRGLFSADWLVPAVGTTGAVTAGAARPSPRVPQSWRRPACFISGSTCSPKYFISSL